MRYLDVCAGISASSVAWKPLGWEAAAYSEIEPAPRAILEHRQGALPVGWDHRHAVGSNTTPLFGDFTQIEAHHVGPIDLLVGGTPCQDFSVAGLRAGLDGDRGNLSLEFLRLADRTRPRWVVWENVPGVLSINGGRAFGAILGGLGELGYGFAYAVLDAQHFGVPQRRRRVFIVGYLGDHRRASAVLLERHSLSGHPAPRRGEDQAVAGAITRDAFSGGAGGRPEGAAANHFIPQGCGGEVAPTLNAAFGSKLGLDNQHVDSGAGLFVTHAIQAGALRENPASGPDGVGVQEDCAYTLEARAEVQAIAFSIMPMNSGKDYVGRETQVAQPLMAGGPVGGNQGGDFIVPINPNALRGDTRAITPSRDAAGVVRLRDPGLGVGADGDPADTLQAAGPGAVATSSAVRRLTPRECERLQGFPDDYTLVPNRGKPMADGPRYKALGNSMAVPVMRWIGERIAQVDALEADQRDAA